MTEAAAQPEADPEIIEEISELESDEVPVEIIEKEPDPLAKAEQELAAARDEYLRLAAEFDNYKKRQARNIDAIMRGANERLMLNLLEVLDNFERALSLGEENPEIEKYHQGMRLIYDQLLATLQREGLSRFVSLGEQFDPNLHEALLTLQSDDYEPDQIAQEIAPGYKLHDKVLRHARVGVVGPKEEKNED
ncbi:MAG: nucleotide exchange factor GrpE [bacterium]